MKKTRWILVGLMMVLAVFANAQTLTNTIADVRDSTVIQDTSTYPTLNAKRGLIVRHYDFSRNGGAAGAKSLEFPQNSTGVPKEVFVVGGFINVQTAVLPATATNSLGLNTTTDILAAGTNQLTTTGVKAIVPVWTAGTAVRTTADRALVFTSHSAITSGVFTVYLDVIGR